MNPLQTSDGSVIRFCPFCGSGRHLKVVKKLPRCEYCWRVFAVTYSRPVGHFTPSRTPFQVQPEKEKAG